MHKQPTEKSGHMMYTPPIGWNFQEYADGVILTPPNISQDQYKNEIIIMTSISPSSTLEQALEQSCHDVSVTLQDGGLEIDCTHYSIASNGKSFKGWDYIKGVNVFSLYGVKYSMILFVVKLDDRVERIAVISQLAYAQLLAYSPYDHDLEYRNTVDEFLFSIKFDDWKEPVIHYGTLIGDDIVGVWQGISMFAGIPKIGAELGAEYKVATAIFLSNGQVYFADRFPHQGLEGLNTWIDAERNKREWGTYSFQHGQGVLNMSYGEIPIKMSGQEIILTTNQVDHKFIRLPSVDDAIFAGTYAFDNDSNSKYISIRFTTDGTFTDDGVLNRLSHSYCNPFNITEQPGRGIYKVKNFTVVFNYTDGRIFKLAFPGIEFDKNNTSPQKLTLSFNNDELTKQ